MHSVKQLIVLLALIQFSFLNAWIQHQNNGRRHMFKLASSSSSGSEDLNFQRQRKQLESVFKKDKVDYESDETLHIGGLFESLSVLPVYDWAETEFDLVGCRDDECEVSHSGRVELNDIISPFDPLLLSTCIASFTTQSSLFFSCTVSFSNVKFLKNSRVPIPKWMF